MMFTASAPIILIVIGVLLGAISATPVEHINRANKIPFTFGDVVSSSKFRVSGFNGTWIGGSEFVYKNNDSNIIRYNVETAQHTLFFNAEVLNQWQNPSWTLSPDNQRLLIRHNVTQVFRHSIVASYAIYEIATQQVTDVAAKSLLSLCMWSPNSQHIVYVLDNDAYFLRDLRTTVRLTSDGVVGVVYNGVPDWVYEEEVFGSGGAIWVAPNEPRLVMASFDDKAVREFTYNLYGEQYESEVKLRYPKVGTTNPSVTLRHIDLNDPQLAWKTIPAPLAIVSADHVLRSVAWLDDRTFGAVWMNRRQNRSVFQKCNAATNICEEVFETQEPNGWIEMKPMKCVESGDRCFYIDYIRNWANIYEYTVATGVRREFVVDAFTVLTIYGYNVAADEIYYLATSTAHPHQRHVYRNRDCLTCQLLDPEQQTCTYASAVFSKDLSHFAVTCSGPTVPYVALVRTRDNSRLLDWEQNLVTRSLIARYDLPSVHYLNIPVGDGHTAAVKLLLPSSLGSLSSLPAKPYPMVVDVYAGPNADRVVDSFSLGYKQYLITSHKVIYAQIDGRGSGLKGKDMLFEINNRLGTVEIEDQIAVTRQLQQKFPQLIDAQRTAIWGWSYGGYATARILAEDREQVFRCGISVAPVSSWMYYDSIYTERYMGLPTAEDNWANYQASDISQGLATNALRKHAYMLVHGNADDNVHYQNALIFSEALVEANVDFEQVSYPNEAHGLSGVQSHLYHGIDKFWVKCLNLTTS